MNMKTIKPLKIACVAGGIVLSTVFFNKLMAQNSYNDKLGAVPVIGESRIQVPLGTNAVYTPQISDKNLSDRIGTNEFNYDDRWRSQSNTAEIVIDGKKQNWRVSANYSKARKAVAIAFEPEQGPKKEDVLFLFLKNMNLHENYPVDKRYRSPDTTRAYDACDKTVRICKEGVLFLTDVENDGTRGKWDYCLQFLSFKNFYRYKIYFNAKDISDNVEVRKDGNIIKVVDLEREKEINGSKLMKKLEKKISRLEGKLDGKKQGDLLYAYYSRRLEYFKAQREELLSKITLKQVDIQSIEGKTVSNGLKTNLAGRFDQMLNGVKQPGERDGGGITIGTYSAVHVEEYRLNTEVLNQNKINIRKDMPEYSKVVLPEGDEKLANYNLTHDFISVSNMIFGKETGKKPQAGQLAAYISGQYAYLFAVPSIGQDSRWYEVTPDSVKQVGGKTDYALHLDPAFGFANNADSNVFEVVSFNKGTDAKMTNNVVPPYSGNGKEGPDRLQEQLPNVPVNKPSVTKGKVVVEGTNGAVISEIDIIYPQTKDKAVDLDINVNKEK